MAIMLGADLDSMGALGADIDSTATEIVDVGADARSVAERVTAEITEAFTGAVTQITDRTNAMSDRVAQARSTAESTEWTGANRDIFVGAAGDFSASCTQIALDAASVLQEFDRQVALIAANVLEFQGALQINLDQATASAESMSAAVAAQASSLDQTMNTGMQVG